ncbi:MAG: hypothetical protein AABX03_02725 [Nanoarchaeota archaeon]
MGLWDYLGIRKYFPKATIGIVLSPEEKLGQDRLRKLEGELNDFPHSNSEIEYVYLKEPVMKAILRDCHDPSIPSDSLDEFSERHHRLMGQQRRYQASGAAFGLSSQDLLTYKIEEARRTGNASIKMRLAYYPQI